MNAACIYSHKPRTLNLIWLYNNIYMYLNTTHSLLLPVLGDQPITDELVQTKSEKQKAKSCLVFLMTLIFLSSSKSS